MLLTWQLLISHFKWKFHIPYDLLINFAKRMWFFFFHSIVGPDRTKGCKFHKIFFLFFFFFTCQLHKATSSDPILSTTPRGCMACVRGFVTSASPHQNQQRRMMHCNSSTLVFQVTVLLLIRNRRKSAIHDRAHLR